MGSRFSQVQEINALPSTGPDSLEASPCLEQVCPCSRRGSDPIGQQAELSRAAPEWAFCRTAGSVRARNKVVIGGFWFSDVPSCPLAFDFSKSCKTPWERGREG